MKFKDTIEILRPINCVMGSLTVIIGILNIILGVLTYFFLAGSGMVINDIYDIEIDKINRPERPIPRGSITIKQARIIFLASFLIGIIISIIHSIILQLGFLNIIIAALFGFIGWVYAKWGKKQGFFGNIIVSVSFSVGLIYGAILNSALVVPYIYFFFLTAFFLLLSREIIKGCEDIEGDNQFGIKTLAIQIGIKKTTTASIIADICAIIFFILPIFTPITNPIFFLISMIFGLVIVIYATTLSFKRNLERKDFKKISLFLKIGALLGLIAFIFASI